MDCLETWEIPLTSACEQTGRSGRRLNNDPGPESPPTYRALHIKLRWGRAFCAKYILFVQAISKQLAHVRFGTTQSGHWLGDGVMSAFDPEPDPPAIVESLEVRSFG